MINFYGKETPKVGDLIVCRIDTISNNSGGYWVELLEYGNKAGFVGLKEITQAKWFRNLRGLAHEGDVEVMQVISVGDHGDIDLSRRYINEKSREMVLNRYKTWKRVYDYLDHMVDAMNREVVIGEVLHPYLNSMLQEHEETQEDEHDEERQQHDEGQQEEQEEGQEQEEQNDKDILKFSLSEWLKRNNEIELQEEQQRDILDNITRLLERPVECKQQNGHLQLERVARLRIDMLNEVLRKVREKFPVRIVTHSTKSCTFQVSTVEKMSQIDFVNLLEDILRFVNSMDLSAICLDTTLVQTQTQQQQENSQTQQQQHQQPLCNIGIVGHVAHGKTTIIEAISGVDTRRYKSEVATNRTLNIGYTNVTVCKCTCDDALQPIYLSKKDIQQSCRCERVLVSVVDCPGHNVLLSTMITGAHIMDTCVLVIAADEQAPQPQTNEHVAVLQIVGSSEAHFSDGVIVQNKVDLVSDLRLSSSLGEIQNFIKGTVFEKSPIIPTSAQLSLNVHHVLKFIYEYANNFSKREIEVRAGRSKGIIVRTFDINKPGTETVKGAVVGGSIIKGEFSIGEVIVLLPIGVEARILSMKTDKTDLSTARVGGLIAIQTDINPTYCNVLTGCAFVKKSDYDSSRMIQSDSLIKCKYAILNDCKIDKIPSGTTLTINYAGCNTEVQVVRSSSDKYRMVLRIRQPLYVFPEENFTFTIVANNRLVGFGRGVDYEKINVPSGSNCSVSLDSYENLLSEFNEALQDWKERSAQKLRLPVPRAQFKNTFTTITNFESVCNALEVTPEDLGRYICLELGLKSHSVNSMKQLVLKGRTDEKRIITVLHRYIQEKRCLLCRRNTIITVKNMGVKQKVCTHCSLKPF